MCYNTKLDLVNVNPYIKFGEILSIYSKDIVRKFFLGVNQGPLLWYKCAKMKYNNPKLDIVNVKAYIKTGEILLAASWLALDF